MDVATAAAAATTALLGAMVTDAWGRSVAGITALWRRVRPDEEEAVRTALTTTQTQVLAAHQCSDAAALRRLEIEWYTRFRDLLDVGGPEVATELRELACHGFAERPNINQRGTASGNGSINQVGGNQYNLGSSAAGPAV